MGDGCEETVWGNFANSKKGEGAAALSAASGMTLIVFDTRLTKAIKREWEVKQKKLTAKPLPMMAVR